MQECVILHLESQPVADLQKVHQHFQCSNKRHRIQNKTGTNKACIISASLSGTLGNPIIIDDWEGEGSVAAIFWSMMFSETNTQAWGIYLKMS
jgi:hypothetical protein